MTLTASYIHTYACTLTPSCSPSSYAHILLIIKCLMRKYCFHAPDDLLLQPLSHILYNLSNIVVSSLLYFRYLSRLTLTAFFKYQHQTREQVKQRRSPSLPTRADSLKRRLSAWSGRQRSSLRRIRKFSQELTRRMDWRVTCII